MSPGHKRQIVESLVTGGQCSARAACRHFELHRSTFAYQAKEPDAWLAKLKAALRRMSNKHPELGYPKITRLLKKEGWKVGSRIIQKLRRELGLAAASQEAEEAPQGRFHRLADEGHASWSRMDLGLRSRYDHAGRQAAHAKCAR